MNIENQVCSLELANRLKELGVKQESLFWWFNDDLKGGFCLKREGELFEGSEFQPREGDGDISAFTVSELGEMLPQVIDQHDEYSPYFLNIHPCTTPSGRCWQIRYGKADHGDSTISITRESLADTFATALIYLLENKLI